MKGGAGWGCEVYRLAALISWFACSSPAAHRVAERFCLRACFYFEGKRRKKPAGFIKSFWSSMYCNFFTGSGSLTRERSLQLVVRYGWLNLVPGVPQQAGGPRRADGPRLLPAHLAPGCRLSGSCAGLASREQLRAGSAWRGFSASPSCWAPACAARGGRESVRAAAGRGAPPGARALRRNPRFLGVLSPPERRSGCCRSPPQAPRVKEKRGGGASSSSRVTLEKLPSEEPGARRGDSPKGASVPFPTR